MLLDIIITIQYTEKMETAGGPPILSWLEGHHPPAEWHTGVEMNGIPEGSKAFYFHYTLMQMVGVKMLF